MPGKRLVYFLPKLLAMLQQFEPLSRLTLGRLNELASICIVETISENLDPMRMNTQIAQSVYLVKGELGVRYKDGAKAILKAGTNQAQYPINAGQRPIKYTRALTPIEVVRIDEDLLEAAKSVADSLIIQYPTAVESHLERWMSHAGELVKV